MVLKSIGVDSNVCPGEKRAIRWSFIVLDVFLLLCYIRSPSTRACTRLCFSGRMESENTKSV